MGESPEAVESSVEVSQNVNQLNLTSISCTSSAWVTASVMKVSDGVRILSWVSSHPWLGVRLLPGICLTEVV